MLLPEEKTTRLLAGWLVGGPTSPGLRPSVLALDVCGLEAKCTSPLSFPFTLPPSPRHMGRLLHTISLSQAPLSSFTVLMLHDLAMPPPQPRPLSQHPLPSLAAMLVVPEKRASLARRMCGWQQRDSDIQKKIDHEIRMRDGTCKLLAACSQRDQALEAAKSLLTCNARILAYMSELQRMKEAQVMQRVGRRSSDAGPLDERLPCKGKVAISELHRCAVFCVLQLGGQIYDTDMVMVDRTLTDISSPSSLFRPSPLFSTTSVILAEAKSGHSAIDVTDCLHLRVELYSCCMEEEFSTGNAPKKLASKLSSSLGRSSGKKIRAALEPGACSPVSNGGGAPLLLPSPSVPGPKYHLLAHTTLTLVHVRDSFRTHDLSICGNEECSYWLPLYGSVCCRLAAQPDCMTQQMMSGSLKVKQLGEDHQSWTTVHGVLRGTNLICFHRKEDEEAKVEPAFTIAINKTDWGGGDEQQETRIRATEKDPLSKAQSISISNHYGGEEVTHTLATDSRGDTQRWMEAFWQQFYDMSEYRCAALPRISVTMVLGKRGGSQDEPPSPITRSFHSERSGEVIEVFSGQGQDSLPLVPQRGHWVEAMLGGRQTAVRSCSSKSLFMSTQHRHSAGPHPNPFVFSPYLRLPQSHPARQDGPVRLPIGLSK
ncbi:hypothetical protein JZ751_012399 [Albula glossodonta]|uniref:REM-1 domain-containing protein n=1 Tax=Albula glossodonta TaxID=121402 RepID=A0A8T2PSE0_9TELE|nr:hypothetical protein JZ751_012399 [Albula glossodonta]